MHTLCVSQTVPLGGRGAEPERMKSMSQLAVLTRRWCPAQMKLEPFREVVLESSSVDELKEKVIYPYGQSLPTDPRCKVNDDRSGRCFILMMFVSLQLSEISAIPLENLEFAKV